MFLSSLLLRFIAFISVTSQVVSFFPCVHMAKSCWRLGSETESSTTPQTLDQQGVGKDITPVMDEGPTLKGKTVLVCGANGRTGAQVVRTLLRTSQARQVRAVVRSVDELESYARLSRESGAEDGKGTISAVWVSREVSFEGTADMASYNLAKLAVLPGDLLDESFVKTAVRDVDCIVWCAASKPALSLARGFDLLRNLGKGAGKQVSVEAEGVALAAETLRTDLRRRALGFARQAGESRQPNSFVLLSNVADASPPANQRRGEELLAEASLPSFVVVRSARFDDFFPTGSRSNEEGGEENAEAGVSGARVACILENDASDLTGAERISREEAAGFLAGVLVDESKKNQVVRIFAE
mmetsp:Transcript_74348/g.145224  ORF Transcript_74348/g.145224 Transcript_74348/m.145224 type:complete len:356 (+) Transcript_74348:93-1160(+)